MRTTITIDDELFKAAREFSPNLNAAEIVREAIKSYIELEAGRRLAALGGSSPEMEYISRGRNEDEDE